MTAIKRLARQRPSAQQVEEMRAATTALMEAEVRIGDSPEARVRWLLTFLQKDLDSLSRGDWLNLSDEIRMYGSPFPAPGTGVHYHTIDLHAGRMTISPQSLIRTAQAKLLSMLTKLLSGEAVTTPGIKIRLSNVVIPNRSRCESAWLGDPLDLLTVRTFLDLQEVEIDRVRHCELGTRAGDKEAGLPVCGRLFYAEDRRQRLCSPDCSQKARWTRYWKSHREEINARRRKNVRRRTGG